MPATAGRCGSGLDMTLSNRDGQDVQMVSDYLTWESKDGTKLRFHMKQSDRHRRHRAGGGRCEPDGGLARPATIHYTMPDGQDAWRCRRARLFPMAHTAAIITAAEAGKKFLTVPLFDGTGRGWGAEHFHLHQQLDGALGGALIPNWPNCRPAG